MILYFASGGQRIEEMKVIREENEKIGILLSYAYVKNTKNSDGNKRFQDFCKLKTKKESLDED